MTSTTTTSACTCAKFSQICSECDKRIFIGDPVVKSYECLTVIAEFCKKLCPREVMGKTLEDVLVEYLGGPEKMGAWIHRNCNPNITKTSSGRRTVKPVRFDERKFVKGSGLGGDHYQRGFDYKSLGWDYGCHNEKIAPLTMSDCSFVVKDDEVAVQHILADELDLKESNDEEWNSGDESEEEECSWDSNASDSDDE